MNGTSWVTIVASAASCSRHGVAWLPAPDSHPCHRTSTSRRRACARTRPLLAPRLTPFALPPLALAPRSSAPPCACSSTCPLLLSFVQIILSFVPKEGRQVNLQPVASLPSLMTLACTPGFAENAQRWAQTVGSCTETIMQACPRIMVYSRPRSRTSANLLLFPDGAPW
jgi:hypothetical protein